MGTAERILAELERARRPLADAELAEVLGLRHQAVNQTCRSLERLGRIRRLQTVGAPIRNVLVQVPARDAAERPAPTASAGLLTEDEVKAAVKEDLVARGYDVEVAWGRSPGVDIVARCNDGRLMLEAKGEAANPPQQVNYFLGAIGELVQRLDDPDAHYGLALPDHRQYRGLVSRLPRLAWTRLQLVVLFVRRVDGGFEVEWVDPPTT